MYTRLYNLHLLLPCCLWNSF